MASVLPMYSSYATLKQYQRVVANLLTATITIKGVSFPNPLSNVPSEHPLKEEELQYSLNLQKWLIFWIVHASFALVESVLFLKYLIPFYNFFKFGANVWMLSGISIADLLWPGQIDTMEKLTAKWTEFTENGCGMVFYTFIKPVLEYPIQDVVLPYVGQLKSQLPTNVQSSEESVFGSSYILVKNFTSKLRPEQGTTAAATGVATKEDPDADAIEEFDMVDVEKVPEPKKGWIW